MDLSHIAWAAGLFEAEGSLSHHTPKGRRTPRASLDLSQKGGDVIPEVLDRFGQVVGCGQIFGPYRGYLFYWRTHDVAIIASVVLLLWPWLSTERRDQMRKTLEAVPALWLAAPFGDLLARHLERSENDESRLAWAAGFFEGDGTIGAYRSRRSKAQVLTASIAQASDSGVPSALTRFQAVAGAGSIYGPITPRGWSRLSQYRWQAQGRSAARIAQDLLPWLAGPKKKQVTNALDSALSRNLGA